MVSRKLAGEAEKKFVENSGRIEDGSERTL